ncbi:MAG: hypothetical protein RSD42_07800 [Oscillospiraceae bacterium]
MDKVIELAIRLKGITYSDWLKVRTIIDKSFEMQKRELENSLQLSDSEQLQKATRSLFG